MQLNQILYGDVILKLLELDDRSVNTIVTSPPYYALRDYKLPKTKWPEIKWHLFGIEITTPAMECCLGLEKNPHDFIGHMVYIFRLAKRVLRDDGTCWINMGDSFAAKGGAYNKDGSKGTSSITSPNTTKANVTGTKRTPPDGIKAKDLMGIPWMMAFALREDGWYLRQDIIWSKPNPMPESCTDRCTKSHEYIFLLSKSPRYYYDAKAIATPYADKTYTTFGHSAKGKGDGSGLIASENWGDRVEVRKPKVWKTPDGWDTGEGTHGSYHREGREKGETATQKNLLRDGKPHTMHESRVGKSGNKKRVPAAERGVPEGTGKNQSGSVPWEGDVANKRSVWTVATKPFAEAHFATFPEALIVDCIKAGCPPNGVVLDIFMGAGTTALVSRKLGRNFIGIDLNKEYIEDIANPRLIKELGLFLEL